MKFILWQGLLNGSLAVLENQEELRALIRNAWPALRFVREVKELGVHKSWLCSRRKSEPDLASSQAESEERRLLRISAVVGVGSGIEIVGRRIKIAWSILKNRLSAVHSDQPARTIRP